MAEIVAVISDLIFSSKIQGTGQALGLEVRVVGTCEALQEALDQGAVRLVVVDMSLNADIAPAALKLTAAHSSKPPSVAFYPHVQQEWRQAAEDAGADVVMVRSQFSETLPQLMKKYCELSG